MPVSTLLLAAGAALAAAEVAPITPTKGVKNVVFTLIKGGANPDDYEMYFERTTCLQNTLDALGAKYDAIAFHEGNIADDMKAALEAEVPGLRLVDAHDFDGFEVPAFIGDVKAVEGPERDSLYSIGYRHMCRFMSMLWFKALANYEYAMRVDEDVCMQSFGGVDPFQAMADSGSVYAYGVETIEEHMETTATMTPWVRAYQAEHSLAKDTPVTAGTIYFNNFFISKVGWWLTDAVQRYLYDVDHSVGIYSHRWGDAPIQTTAVKLLAPPANVTHLPATYLHLSGVNAIEGGEMVPFSSNPETLRHPIVVAHFRRRGLMSMTWTNGTHNETYYMGLDNETYYDINNGTDLPDHDDHDDHDDHEDHDHDEEPDVWKVIITFTIAGTVDDITDEMKIQMAALIAELAGVELMYVTLVFEAGSVVVTAEVVVANAVAAAALAATVATDLDSQAELAAFFGAIAGVVVESGATATTAFEPAATPQFAPAPPPSLAGQNLGDGDDDDVPIGAIVGGVVGGVVGVGVIGGVAYMLSKKKGAKQTV